MDTHEPVPMTRRRYRSLVAAAEDAARTTASAAAMAATAEDMAAGVSVGTAVVPAPGGPGPLTLMVRPRRGQVPVVPSPRTRRRASIRRSAQPLAS